MEKTYVDRYSGEVETSTGECRVHSFSDAEAANPTTPHGINVILYMNVNPAPKAITFGIPDLSPIYAFGMRAATHSTHDDDILTEGHWARP